VKTQTTAALRQIEGIASSIHDLSHRLHPHKLQLLGLVPALRGLQRDMTRPGIVVDLSHRDVAATLSADLALCFFRIAEEAVHNAAHHGRARHVSIVLCQEGELLTLTIVDDGLGFEVDGAWGTGLGLISMRERLALLGGSLAIHSSVGVGTTVACVAPLRPVAAEQCVRDDTVSATGAEPVNVRP
jgi:signal transduction histidine kinase